MMFWELVTFQLLIKILENLLKSQELHLQLQSLMEFSDWDMILFLFKGNQLIF